MSVRILSGHVLDRLADIAPNSVQVCVTSLLMQMWHDRSLLGQKVRIEGMVRQVETIYETIPGGVRLDKPVAGFVSWNVDALILVSNPKT